MFTGTLREELHMPQITPNLWFDNNGLEAAEFYVSVFPNSKITNVTHYTEAGPGAPGDVLTVDFVLDGQRVTALNGGPELQLDAAFSFVVDCADQDEVDHYWDKLREGGGQEVQCGWLTDRFGLSWQVVPTAAMELVADDDPERAARVTRAMFGMKKLDLAALQAAANGN
jgi:predicted 3-demethylubiquinone-9 3-methyltransferase (glyoxalase superfamily)